MPTLSIKNLNLFNIIASVVLVGLSFYFKENASLSNLNGLDILGIVMFIFSIVNVVVFKELGENVSRYILLATFIAALLVSFVPYFGGFSDNTNLFVLANSVSAVWLLTLFFTNYKFNQ